MCPHINVGIFPTGRFQITGRIIVIPYACNLFFSAVFAVPTPVNTRFPADSNGIIELIRTFPRHHEPHPCLYDTDIHSILFDFILLPVKLIHQREANALVNNGFLFPVRVIFGVEIVLSALLLLVSCTNSDVDKKKVKIAYANWLEGIAMSHLAKVVLEEQGYEVELQNADLAPIFVSMSGKKSDVFLDAWLPITMKDYLNQYGDSLEFLGEVYGEARV